MMKEDFEFAKKFNLPIKRVVEPVKSFVVTITESLDKNFKDEVSFVCQKIIEGAGVGAGLSLIYTEDIDRRVDHGEKYFTNNCWYIQSGGPVQEDIIGHSQQWKPIRGLIGPMMKNLKKSKKISIRKWIAGIKKEQLDFSTMVWQFLRKTVKAFS